MKVGLFQFHVISLVAFPQLGWGVRQFQDLSSGVNLPLNIDSWVLKNCCKNDKSMNIAPFPTCVHKWDVPFSPVGLGEEKNKRKENKKILNREFYIV